MIDDPPSRGTLRRHPRAHARRPVPIRPMEIIVKLTLFAAVMASAAALVAAALMPVVGGAGGALRTFEQRFFPEEATAVELPPFPERSTILAADGSVLSSVFRDENRTIVDLGSVNRVTRNAVLAIEDHEFYEHGAVNHASILRAFMVNLQRGEVVQGGSTISQQLVKNAFVGNDETLARKLLEARAAVELEQAYSKDEIFELYLNEIYLGNGVYGIGTAAEYYFAKSPEDLSLPEAALLAGMIQLPEHWDPIEAPGLAVQRRDLVLGQMLDLGWISRGRFEAAVASPLELSDARRGALNRSAEPYFVEYIREQLLSDPRLGVTRKAREALVYGGGLRVHTTLMPGMQEEAKAAATRYLPNPGQRPPADPSSAVVSIVPQTGAIQAIVGGTNFSELQVDLASQGERPTGSAFKPFTLVAAFEDGVPPGKVYDSEEPVFIPECDRWSVNNNEPGTGEYMNLWDATRGSVNVVFAQLARDVGPERIADAARRMGIMSDLPAICSLTLGTVPVSPLEITSAYGTLANGGIHCDPYAIARVETRDGEVLFHRQPTCRQAIDPQIAARVTAMLRTALEQGTGFRARLDRPAAGKTGTGQEFRDAWFIGYIPQLVTGVWVGYPAGQISMEDVHGIEVLGGTYPAQIWRDYMAAVTESYEVLSFPPAPPDPAGRVPDVRGLSQQAAEEELADANFTTVAEVTSSYEPAGTVVQQSPAPGATETLGSQVTIYVSNGTPAAIEVPGVIGLTEAAATEALQDRSFRVSVETVTTSEESEGGMVLDQRPGGGATAAEGSVVTIRVGVYEPEPSPSPTETVTPSATPSPSPSESSTP